MTRALKCHPGIGTKVEGEALVPDSLRITAREVLDAADGPSTSPSPPAATGFAPPATSSIL